MNYVNDPLVFHPWAKGIPYQIAASGKNTVLVLPLSKVGIQIGKFMKMLQTSLKS